MVLLSLIDGELPDSPDWTGTVIRRRSATAWCKLPAWWFTQQGITRRHAWLDCLRVRQATNACDVHPAQGQQGQVRDSSRVRRPPGRLPTSAAWSISFPSTYLSSGTRIAAAVIQRLEALCGAAISNQLQLRNVTRTTNVLMTIEVPADARKIMARALAAGDDVLQGTEQAMDDFLRERLSTMVTAATEEAKRDPSGPAACPRPDLW